MKRFISQLIVLVSIAILAASCQNVPFITMNTPGSFTFTRDGGSQSITFTCNRPWSATTSESWIQVSPSSGAESEDAVTVKLTCAANTTYDPRSATVTIMVDELTQTVSVNQEQGEGLIVEKTSYEIGQEGGTIEVEVKANVDYEVKPEVDWIHIVETKALSSSAVSLMVDENDLYSTRKGNVTFKQKDGTLSNTVSISQAQKIAVASISLNVNNLTMLVGENEQLIATVSPDNATDPSIAWSSSDVTVASVDEGLVFALSEGRATITATSGSCSATCEVLIINAGGDDGVELTVGQIPNDSPIIHFEGGSDVVSVTGPSHWVAYVSDGDEWCHVTTSGNQLGIRTDTNDSGNGRSAVILLASGSQKKYLEVYQVPQIRAITPSKTRHIRLTQTVSYENRRMSKIWIMLPYVETCDYQTINNFQIGEGGEVTTSKDGYIKYVSFVARPEEMSGTVTAYIDYIATTNYVKVDFNKIDRLFDYDTASPEYAHFTGINEIDGKRYIDPENRVLSAVADDFWESSHGDIVAYCRKCYDYVATAFVYQSGGSGIIEEILSNGGGDCGNIANLFLSMVRHKGIPARPIVMTQPHNDNHVRTEFYLAGYGWIPVDPTNHMSGLDEFGYFTYDWVVSNRDEVVRVGIDNAEWKISILQGCNWWWWCWSDGGDVTGKYDLSEIR